MTTLNYAEIEVEIVRQMGRRYGYPECCIDEFIADLERGDCPGDLRHKQYPFWIGGDGYVPCGKCLSMIEKIGCNG